MPFLVEMIPPKRTFDIVSRVFSLAVDAFEKVRAWFPCFCFEPGRVNFEVCFAAPC